MRRRALDGAEVLRAVEGMNLFQHFLHEPATLLSRHVSKGNWPREADPSTSNPQVRLAARSLPRRAGGDFVKLPWSQHLRGRR